MLQPPSADLAAQAFRADLFDRAGFTLFNTAWFGGHHLPAYSVLYPPLAGLLGVWVVGALAAIVAAAGFGALAGARAGAWIAPGIIASLASGRITFVLGAAFAMTAVLAAATLDHPPKRARPPSPTTLDLSTKGARPLLEGWLRVGVLGGLTALASPVAALFAGLAGTALGLSGRRTGGLVLCASVTVPVLALVVAFPEGGTFPFAVSSFLPAFAAGVAVAALAPRGSALRAGGALYALLCLAAFVVPSPVGGNAARLGILVAAPVAVHLLWPQRRVALAVLALPLAYWVLQPAVRDVRRAHDDPSVNAAFFAPIVDELRGAGPVRVEVPLTQNHGEARHLAAHVAIARGWERQLDRARNALFYEGELTAERYRRWLDDNAVAYVALPRGVPFDAAGEAEKRLIERRPPYLRPTLTTPSWRLLAVRGARPLAEGAGTLTALLPDGFTVHARRAGTVLVRVRFSRYFAVTSGRGCVTPAAGGPWTRVRAARPGAVTVTTRLRPGRCR